MGRFGGKAGWIHPDITIKTLEMIFVTNGVVHIEENGERYSLVKNDILFLDPGVRHFGFRKSDGDVEFYWLHFKPFDRETLGIAKRSRADNVNELKSVLAKCNHVCASGGKKEFIELNVLAMLISPSETAEKKNSAAYKIADFVHANSDAEISVADIAANFGYNPNYASKLFRKTHSVTLKKFTENERVAAVKNYLLSSPYSIKEIAAALNFADSNALSKFFKYHTGLSPSEYRNSFYDTFTNNK